jgi:hypothetical protein
MIEPGTFLVENADLERTASDLLGGGWDSEPWYPADETQTTSGGAESKHITS